MIHSVNNIDACIHLPGEGPPSSALIDEFKRRYIMMPMAIRASPQKSATAKPMLRRRKRKEEKKKKELKDQYILWIAWTYVPGSTLKVDPFDM